MSRILTIFSRDFVELAGMIHIHSNFSHDCAVPLENVCSEAKKADLDFICVTDHHSLEAENHANTAQKDKALMIVGVEVNDTNLENHYLVFNTKNVYSGRTAKEYLELYHSENAVGFIAHPKEQRKCKRFRKYEWNEQDVDSVAGIEIWNYVSSWVGKLNPRVFGIFSLLFPDMFVRKPISENLKFWDSMPEKAAIGSADAHEHSIKIFGKTIVVLTNKRLFRRIRTYVFLPADVDVTRQSIIKAVAQGNSYICNCFSGYPYNFYAGIKGTTGEAIPGEEVQFCENQYLYFLLPQDS